MVACDACTAGEQPGGLATLVAAANRTAACTDYTARVALNALGDCAKFSCSGLPLRAQADCAALLQRCSRDDALPDRQCTTHIAATGHHTAITTVVIVVAGLMLIDAVPVVYGRVAGVAAQAVVATVAVLMSVLPLQTSSMCYQTHPINVAAGPADDTFAPEFATHWHKRWAAHVAVAAAVAAACPAFPAAGRRAAAYIALVLAVVAAASYGARLCPDMRPGPGVYAILAAALASPIAAAAELVAA